MAESGQIELIDWAAERQRARDGLNNALKSGKLQRGHLCEVCGKREPCEGHHHDYSKPLHVTWACNRCHRALDMLKAGRSPEDVVAWWEGE